MHNRFRSTGIPAFVLGLAWLAPLTGVAQEPPPRSEGKPFRAAISKLPENINLQNGAGAMPAAEISQRVATNPNQTSPSASKPPLDPATGGLESNSGGRESAQADQETQNVWQNKSAAGPASNQATGQLGQSNPATSARVPDEITRVSQTFSSLPNEAGQVWREYDILPYTSQIKNVEHPEQAIVDWIISQTGSDLWFHQPLGILNATPEKLIVYHTPEIHNEIRPLVDRFVFSKGQVEGLDVRLCTVGNPNWRETCYSVMQPIAVQSPGVEAWIISKENASLLIGNLGRRADFKSQSGGHLTVADGQSFNLEQRAAKQFAQSVQWTPGQGVGYQPVLAQINEGYRLDMSCLSSVDGRTVDVRLKCAIDQIEKFNNVRIPVPNSPDRVQRVNLQIPQLVSWRVEERFRWPSDQVLLVSCGVVGTSENAENQPLGGLLDLRRNRADALLFIDFRGPETRPPVQPIGPQASHNDLVPIR